MGERLKSVSSLLRKNPPVIRKPVVDPDIQHLQDRLAEKLCARVKLTHNTSGRGKLVIAYNNSEEFEGILERLNLSE